MKNTILRKQRYLKQVAAPWNTEVIEKFKIESTPCFCDGTEMTSLNVNNFNDVMLTLFTIYRVFWSTDQWKRRFRFKYVAIDSFRYVFMRGTQHILTTINFIFKRILKGILLLKL